MVRHHVQQDFQAELMSRRDQFLIILHRAEVVFDGVLVNRAIAVIVGGGVVVVIQRRKPQRGHPEVLQVRQMLLDALQIAAMIGLRTSAVIGSRRRAFGLIVAGIAVGEAIRHDQVNNIVARDSLKLALLR